MKKHFYLMFALALIITGFLPFSSHPAHAAGTVYEVGPGKAYTNIGDVPFESLNPGDTVKIYYRSTPYKEKFVISRMGTATAPITITGVPGPNGELPVIDGNGATTRAQLDFWNDNRSVIKIGGARFAGSASDPANGVLPQYIVIENLEVKGARDSYTYTDCNGVQQTYLTNASPIYVEYGEHITLRNNIITDGGNGLFVASSDAGQSRDILVEGNYIYGNGNVGSIYEHNVYTAAVGITFQYNHLGDLCAGCGGNNLKDRSAGTVIRYNWIDGGNRQLDLVDGEDTAVIRDDPSYHETYVYGNVLISPDDDRNPQMIHYGGDSSHTSYYRKGTLYLYNNTLVTYRSGRTTVVRLSTADETADIRNNIIYKVDAASGLAISDDAGTANLSHNWISDGWVDFYNQLLGKNHSSGTVNDDGTQITGTSPGFVDEANQDFHLAAGSDSIDAGTSLASGAASYPVTMQYVKPQSSEPRPVNGTIDIGAFEY